MALPNNTTISLNQVNTELSRSATASIDMNDSAVRTLAGVGGSGTTISMSNLWGKSNSTTLVAGSLTSDSGYSILSTSWSTQTVIRNQPLYFNVSYTQGTGASFWTDVYYRFWVGSSGDFSQSYGSWVYGQYMYGTSSSTITITPHSAGYFSLGFRLSNADNIQTHNVPIDFYVV
jgi:hypothetical protein